MKDVISESYFCYLLQLYLFIGDIKRFLKKHENETVEQNELVSPTQRAKTGETQKAPRSAALLSI